MQVNGIRGSQGTALVRTQLGSKLGSNWGQTGVKIVFAGPTNIAPQRLSGAAQVSAMPGVGAGLRLLDGAAFKR
jgi:hypothetical protein